MSGSPSVPLHFHSLFPFLPFLLCSFSSLHPFFFLPFLLSSFPPQPQSCELTPYPYRNTSFLHPTKGKRRKQAQILLKRGKPPSGKSNPLTCTHNLKYTLWRLIAKTLNLVFEVPCPLKLPFFETIKECGAFLGSRKIPHATCNIYRARIANWGTGGLSSILSRWWQLGGWQCGPEVKKLSGERQSVVSQLDDLNQVTKSLETSIFPHSWSEEGNTALPLEHCLSSSLMGFHVCQQGNLANWYAVGFSIPERSSSSSLQQMKAISRKAISTGNQTVTMSRRMGSWGCN